MTARRKPIIQKWACYSIHKSTMHRYKQAFPRLLVFFYTNLRNYLEKGCIFLYNIYNKCVSLDFWTAVVYRQLRLFAAVCSYCRHGLFLSERRKQQISGCIQRHGCGQQQRSTVQRKQYRFAEKTAFQLCKRASFPQSQILCGWRLHRYKLCWG